MRWLAVFWVTAVVSAADPLQPLFAPSSDSGETMVDIHHQRTSRWLVRRVEGLNAWLLDTMGGEEERESDFLRHYYGDRISAYDVQGSHIRLSPRLGWSESRGVDPGIDFSARIRLANLSHRLRFYADSYDVDEDGVGNIFSERYRRPVDQERSQSTSAGLTYLLTERTRRQASVSGGLRFRPEPIPQARVRGRLHTEVGRWEPAFVQTLFWDYRDGFGERSEIDLPRHMGRAHLFRSVSAAEWSETSQGVDLGQHLSWSTRLGEHRQLVFRLGARGHTRPATVVDQYQTRVSYSQRAFRDWCTVLLETGVNFARERDYDPDPMVRVTFHVLLGAP